MSRPRYPSDEPENHGNHPRPPSRSCAECIHAPVPPFRMNAHCSVDGTHVLETDWLAERCQWYETTPKRVRIAHDLRNPARLT